MSTSSQPRPLRGAVARSSLSGASSTASVGDTHIDNRPLVDPPRNHCSYVPPGTGWQFPLRDRVQVESVRDRQADVATLADAGQSLESESRTIGKHDNTCCNGPGSHRAKMSRRNCVKATTTEQADISWGAIGRIVHPVSGRV